MPPSGRGGLKVQRRHRAGRRRLGHTEDSPGKWTGPSLDRLPTMQARCVVQPTTRVPGGWQSDVQGRLSVAVLAGRDLGRLCGGRLLGWAGGGLFDTVRPESDSHPTHAAHTTLHRWVEHPVYGCMHRRRRVLGPGRPGPFPLVPPTLGSTPKPEPCPPGGYLRGSRALVTPGSRSSSRKKNPNV